MWNGVLRGRSPARADSHDFGHLLHHRMPGVCGNNNTGSFAYSPKTATTERARRLRACAFLSKLLPSIREVSCLAQPVPTRVIVPIPRNRLTPDLRAVVCPPADRSGFTDTNN